MCVCVGALSSFARITYIHNQPFSQPATEIVINANLIKADSILISIFDSTINDKNNRKKSSSSNSFRITISKLRFIWPITEKCRKGTTRFEIRLGKPSCTTAYWFEWAISIFYRVVTGKKQINLFPIDMQDTKLQTCYLAWLCRCTGIDRIHFDVADMIGHLNLKIILFCVWNMKWMNMKAVTHTLWEHKQQNANYKPWLTAVSRSFDIQHKIYNASWMIESIWFGPTIGTS